MAFEKHACGTAFAAASSDAKSLESRGKFEAFFPNRTMLIQADGPSNTGSAITIDEAINLHKIDAVYTIQGSSRAHWRVKEAKLLVHGVFDGLTREMEGTSFATISECVPRASHVPVVPHIVSLGDSYASTPGLRDSLGILPSARVFCRHGGKDTFQIGFARQALCTHAIKNPGDIFLLLNTNALPCENGLLNIKHLPGNPDLLYKRRFLNTCNACIHGREDGETFGLSVAECASAGLPVITYAHPPPEADYHLRVMGHHALTYKDANSLLSVLQRFDVKFHNASIRRNLNAHLYDRYKPESVILEFLEKFGILEDVIMGRQSNQGDRGDEQL